MFRPLPMALAIALVLSGSAYAADNVCTINKKDEVICNPPNSPVTITKEDRVFHFKAIDEQKPLALTVDDDREAVTNPGVGFTIEAPSQNNDISISTGYSDSWSWVYPNAAEVEVTAKGGDNKLTVTHAVIGKGFIKLGDGNDTVKLHGSGFIDLSTEKDTHPTIDMGDGNNHLEIIGSGRLSGWGLYGKEAAVLGNGNDKILLQNYATLQNFKDGKGDLQLRLENYSLIGGYSNPNQNSRVYPYYATIPLETGKKIIELDNHSKIIGTISADENADLTGSHITVDRYSLIKSVRITLTS